MVNLLIFVIGKQFILSHVEYVQLLLGTILALTGDTRSLQKQLHNT
jgi:hypothetical protein